MNLPAIGGLAARATAKLGPLPVWGWAAIGAGSLVVLPKVLGGGGSNAATPDNSVSGGGKGKAKGAAVAKPLPVGAPLKIPTPFPVFIPSFGGFGGRDGNIFGTPITPAPTGMISAPAAAGPTTNVVTTFDKNRLFPFSLNDPVRWLRPDEMQNVDSTVVGFQQKDGFLYAVVNLGNGILRTVRADEFSSVVKNPVMSTKPVVEGEIVGSAVGKNAGVLVAIAGNEDSQKAAYVPFSQVESFREAVEHIPDDATVITTPINGTSGAVVTPISLADDMSAEEFRAALAP